MAPSGMRKSVEVDLEAARWDSLLQQFDQQSKARFLSVSCKESGAWVNAIPTTQHLSLIPEEFTLGVQMRLGMPIPMARELSTCPNHNCSAPLDQEGFHLLTCGKGPGRVRFHDRLVRVWHGMVLSTGLRASVEKRDLYSDSRRPDIVVPDWQAGAELHLDFSATHPCLPSYVSSSSRTGGAAAATREREKRNHYRDCSGTFHPLVIEYFGRWGPAALRVLNDLAVRAQTNIPDTRRSAFRQFWLQKFGCELIRTSLQTIHQNSIAWRLNFLSHSYSHSFSL